MTLPTTEILNLLETETAGLEHAVVTLSLHIRDGKLVRYVSTREISILPADTEGKAIGCKR